MKTIYLLSLVGALAGCATGPQGPSPQDDLRRMSYEGISLHAAFNAQYLQSKSEKELMDASQEAAKIGLKDPTSAQFRNVRVLPHVSGKIVCGEINGKNSYGGYVGFRPFAASPSGATMLRTGGKYAEVDELSNVGLRAACGY